MGLVPIPAIRTLPIFIAVVAAELPTVALLVPVSLTPLIPLIAMGALPTPAAADPFSLLPLIPLVFFLGSKRAGRQSNPANQNQKNCQSFRFHSIIPLRVVGIILIVCLQLPRGSARPVLAK